MLTINLSAVFVEVTGSPDVLAILAKSIAIAILGSKSIAIQIAIFFKVSIAVLLPHFFQNSSTKFRFLLFYTTFFKI